jgi:hypothetical protein
MSQPQWKFIANLGDKHPIDHGGYFIYIDETGVYPPEAELLVEPENDDGEWVIYRFALEPCTYINGILSDNKYHPALPAWFAKTEEQRAERPQDTTYLKDIADFMGAEVQDLVNWFISDDPQERAAGWMAVGDYHGFENLDNYPLVFTDKDEVLKRYAEELSNQPTTKGNK